VKETYRNLIYHWLALLISQKTFAYIAPAGRIKQMTMAHRLGYNPMVNIITSAEVHKI
jgi:hypothetical protein